MIVAMLLGMALYPLWVMATSDARAESWVHRPDVAGIVMATAMSMPMVAWMVYRGHRALLTVEMVAAMFAGFLVLLPPLWVGAISAATFMVVGHIVMPLLMLLAMLARRGEYTHHHPTPRRARATRSSQPGTRCQGHRDVGGPEANAERSAAHPTSTR